jgi:DNA-binding transcriptional LysR family regulator
LIENRHLRYFLEVARTLHVTKAAEKLHIAQPALTLNIQQLERELGVKLFERDGRRLSLTAAGRVFVTEAEKSLRMFEAAQLAAHRAVRGESGKIAVGFQSMAGHAAIPQLIKEMTARNPEVEISLKEMGSAALKKHLLDGGIDVGITCGLPDPEFAQHRLNAEPLIMAIPKGHALTKKKAVSYRDVKNEAFILPDLDIAESMHAAVLADCLKAGFKPRQIQFAATAQTILGLVAAEFGIAVLPSSAGLLERKGVTLRPILDSTFQARLALKWLPHNKSPIIPKLVACLS